MADLAVTARADDREAAQDEDGRGHDQWVRVAVLVAIGLGVVLRIWMVSSPLGPYDSDEAVAGLMGKQMLHGEFHSFYWGQPYGGAHEAVLLGLLFAVRTPAWLAMELVPIGLSAAGALLVWRVGLRTFDRRGAALAGSLFWCSSAVFIWQSTKERSFYAATMVAGVALLLLALRLLERPSLRDAFLLGAVAGVGWHSSPNIVYLGVPTFIWILVETARKRNWALLRMAPVAVVGVIAGAMPWIYSNLRSGGDSLEVISFVDTTYAFRLGAFAKKAFPHALGVQTPYTDVSLPAKVLYVFLLVGLAVAVLRLPRKAYVLGLGLILSPFIFAAFPTSWYVTEPRYLYFMWPLVALVVGGALGRLRKQGLAMVVLVLIAGSSIVGTAVMVHRSGSAGGPSDFAPENLEPAISRLEAGGQDRVFADYWIAYRLALMTDERIIASPVQTVRYPPYEKEVRASKNPPYLLFTGTCFEKRFLSYLDGRKIPYTNQRAGVVSIVQPGQKVLPEEALGDWALARQMTGTGVC